MDRTTQLATVAMGVIAVAAALSLTRDIAAPAVLALALGIVLAPLTDRAERMGLSRVAAAMLALVVAVTVIGVLLAVLQPVAVALIDAAPKVMRDIEGLLSALRGLSRSLADFGSEVANGVAPPAVAQTAEGGADDMPVPSVTDALLLAPSLLGQALTFMGTLFFFLIGRTEIYDYATRRLSTPDRRAVTSQRLLSAERQVSRYFLTITATNAALGLTTGAVLMAMGLPDAALWGALAFGLNFIVYLGPAILAVGLVVAGIAAFDGLLVAAPAAVFVILNTLEGQFITPAIVGSRIAVNPLVVFLSIIFGLWLWGPIGGIVAIPALLWVRALATGTGTSRDDTALRSAA